MPELKTNYKLGVLISVYRAERPELFRRAILSVLEQRLNTNAEVRVYLGVDGPIPEELDRAIRDLEPELYKVMRFPQNRGLAHVLNDLIAAREDEDFFFRMDTDDASAADRFDKQLQYMLSRPSIDVLGTDILEVEEHTQDARVVHFADDPVAARRNIAMRVPVAHPTVCFRASVFDRVTGYPLTRLNEDVAMWFVCLQAGLAFDNVAEPLYEFRITDQFWSRRGLGKAWLEFKTYCSGLWALEGATWRYVFPVMRLGVRVIPASLQRIFYQSPWRTQRGQTASSAVALRASLDLSHLAARMLAK